jgi:hypothetical protein
LCLRHSRLAISLSKRSAEKCGQPLLSMTLISFPMISCPRHQSLVYPPLAWEILIRLDSIWPPFSVAVWLRLRRLHRVTYCRRIFAASSRSNRRPLIMTLPNTHPVRVTSTRAAFRRLRRSGRCEIPTNHAECPSMLGTRREFSTEMSNPLQQAQLQAVQLGLLAMREEGKARMLESQAGTTGPRM